jgi:chromosomal replication initiation ATPase DnaA
MVDQWPNWPSYGALIIGPAGSGKSHLANVWQQRTGALVVSAKDLRLNDLPNLLSNNALVVEDIDQGQLPERELFHCLNLAMQQSGTVLLTTRQLPLFTIKDLASRIMALPQGHIKPADDALLRGVLVKLFGDRQIAIDEALISFMLSRMPRSLESARNLVAEIDQQALEQGAEITKVFVGRILAQQQNPELF